MTHTHRVTGKGWVVHIVVNEDGICTKVDSNRAWMKGLAIEHINHWVRQHGGHVVKNHEKSHATVV